MSSTTAATVPLVIRASFLFSGMFGIRLEGLHDQNGQPLTVQSAMPLNFTLPAIVMNKNLQQNGQPFNSNSNSSAKCLENCNKHQIVQLPPNFIHSSEYNVNKHANNNEHGVPTSPLLEILVRSTPPPGKPCGPGRCSHEEICVSWIKQTGVNRKKNHLVSRRQSPTMVHECLPNDGIHWTKMNPSGAKLCETGKTHSILLKQSHKHCADKQNLLNPKHDEQSDSCEVVWSYECVDEKESPHSCSLRECPFKGACIEVKTCDLRRLCYVEAVCTPEFLIPSNVRQNLRTKTGK